MQILKKYSEYLVALLLLFINIFWQEIDFERINFLSVTKKQMTLKLTLKLTLYHTVKITVEVCIVLQEKSCRELLRIVMYKIFFCIFFIGISIPSKRIFYHEDMVIGIVQRRLINLDYFLILKVKYIFMSKKNVTSHYVMLPFCNSTFTLFSIFFQKR